MKRSLVVVIILASKGWRIEKTNMTIGRCLSAILILPAICGVFVARGQSVGPLLTDAERADIVGSLLQLEIVEQGSEYERIRNLSSDNIGSVPAAQIVAHDFRLLTAEQIETLRRDHIIEYVAIRGFYLRDGVVVVRVSRVTEGRPCFSRAFSQARSFTYEFQRGSNGWVGRLVSKALPFSLGRSLSVKP